MLEEGISSEKELFPGVGCLERLGIGGSHFHCDVCGSDVTRHPVRIRCATCTDFDLCTACFCKLESKGDHEWHHEYIVIGGYHLPLTDTRWSALEEFILVDGVSRSGLGNWNEIAESVSFGTIVPSNSKKAKLCDAHYTEDYLNYQHSAPPLIETLIPLKVNTDTVSYLSDTTKSDLVHWYKIKDIISSQPTDLLSTLKKSNDNKMTEIKHKVDKSRSDEDKNINNKIVGSNNTDNESKTNDNISNDNISEDWEQGDESLEDQDFKQSKQSREIDSKLRKAKLLTDNHDNQVKLKKSESHESTHNNNLRSQTRSQMKAGNHNVQGYLPLRDDLENEYDHDCENLIAGLDFEPDDDPINREMKLLICYIFNSRIAERTRRRRVMTQKSSIDPKKMKFLEICNNQSERNLAMATYPLIQHLSEEEHAKYVELQLIENRICHRLQFIREWLSHGLTTLEDLQNFESDLSHFKAVGAIGNDRYYMDSIRNLESDTNHSHILKYHEQELRDLARLKGSPNDFKGFHTRKAVDKANNPTTTNNEPSNNLIIEEQEDNVMKEKSTIKTENNESNTTKEGDLSNDTSLEHPTNLTQIELDDQISPFLRPFIVLGQNKIVKRSSDEEKEWQYLNDAEYDFCKSQGITPLHFTYLRVLIAQQALGWYNPQTEYQETEQHYEEGKKHDNTTDGTIDGAAVKNENRNDILKLLERDSGLIKLYDPTASNLEMFVDSSLSIPKPSVVQNNVRLDTPHSLKTNTRAHKRTKPTSSSRQQQSATAKQKLVFRKKLVKRETEEGENMVEPSCSQLEETHQIENIDNTENNTDNTNRDGEDTKPKEDQEEKRISEGHVKEI